MFLTNENKKFIKKLLKLGVPIVFQHFLYSLLNLVDSFMIGQLGESNITAVGIANQCFYLYVVILASIGSGGAIFTAQYWGAKNLFGLKKILTICLTLSFLVGVVFTTLIISSSKSVLELFSTDSNVINLGSKYLFIVGFSYIPTAITIIFSQLLKSTEKVKVPLFISFISMICNVGLNYILIFGKAGFQPLGITGAAIGTLIARIIEMILILVYVYKGNCVFKLKVLEFLSFDLTLLKKYIKTSLPLVLSQTGWILATLTFNYVYSHMGTIAYASISIYASIEQLFFVIFLGISDASAVIIGNLIGENKIKKVKSYSKKLMFVILLIGIVSGVTIYLSSDFLLNLYKIGDVAYVNTIKILNIFSFVCIIKAFNQLMIMGLFTSGGDTKFAFKADVLVIWLIGVPLAFIGWKIIKLPVYYLFLLVNMEEIIKFSICIKHLLTWKWINRVDIKEDFNLKEVI